MARTSDGKKIVPVKPYERVQDGKVVKVHRHDRSTPKNSKGEGK